MNPAASFESSLCLEALRRIDAVCDRFEEALQAGSAPSLEDLVEAVPASQRPALLRALVDLELEYRRARGEEPTPEDYLTRFPHAPEAVLAAFADDPEAPMPEDLCRLQMSLRRAAGRRADRLRIYHQGALFHTAALTGPLELGRQMQGEAGPFALTHGRDELRLVIAPLEETTVSRRHAYVSPQEMGGLRVHNLSGVNPILFSGGRRLETGQSESFSLPLDMCLGAMFLRIDHPEPPEKVFKGLNAFSSDPPSQKK